MPLNGPGQLFKMIYPGEQVDVQATVTPSGASAGWSVGLTSCMSPNGFATPPVSNPSADVYQFTFSTIGWPVGSYHWTLWRFSPQPEALLDIRIFVRGC